MNQTQYFDAMPRALRIQAENEVAVILSNFSTEYVYNIIQANIQMKRENFVGVNSVNFVSSLEEAFKGMENQYPFDITNIREIRDRTYEEIINFITAEYDLESVYQDEEEKYTLAYYLYDFFIARYDTLLLQYFISVIHDEKDNLYNWLSNNTKINENDVSTQFNKELYQDEKLAVIAANLTKVIGWLYGLDIAMEQVFNRVYNQEIMMFLTNHLKASDQFIKTTYGQILEKRQLYDKVLVLLKIKLQHEATGGRMFSYGINNGNV